MSLNTDVHSVRRRFWVYAVLFLATVGLAGWVRAQESGARDRIYAVSHVDVVPTDAAAGTKLLQQYVVDSRKDKGAVRVEAYIQVSRINHRRSRHTKPPPTPRSSASRLIPCWVAPTMSACTQSRNET